MKSGNRNSDLNVAKWQLQLMRLLPSGANEKGKSVEDLIGELLGDGARICRDDKDKEALRRKIQKSLQSLAQDETWGTKLVCRVEGKQGMEEVSYDNRRKTYWKWKESKSSLIIPPPNEHACLALLMVEKRLKEELPPPTLEYLQPYFNDAKNRIQAYGGPGNRYVKWHQKIVNQSPTQTLKPAKQNTEVHDAVLRALYENCQLSLSYLKPGSSQYQYYEVNPLGVVMRGPATYLVACKVAGDSDENGEGSQERMFALHRIRKAEMLLDQKAKPPKGVTFEGFIERGGSDFVIGKLANGQIIKLVAKVSKEVASKLNETPLAGNQTLTKIDGKQFRLTASLPITMQLGWWLLAFGPRIEVINPPELREWIASEHRNAAKRYR